MSELVGKTIARVDDDGDTIYFTDGTALRITSDDGHYTEVLDRAAVQARLHAEQGDRERQRMRRLEASLPPRDRELLAERRRLAQERADREWEATATPAQIGMRNVMREWLEDMRRDANRTLDLPTGGMTITIPKVNQKGRARRS